MDRQTKFLWMKDLLEHLGACYDNWQAADASSEQFLAETMLRDLDEFRRVCSSLKPEVRARSTAAA